LKEKRELSGGKEEMKSASIKTIRQITQRWEDLYRGAKLAVP